MNPLYPYGYAPGYQASYYPTYPSVSILAPQQYPTYPSVPTLAPQPQLQQHQQLLNLENLADLASLLQPSNYANTAVQASPLNNLYVAPPPGFGPWQPQDTQLGTIGMAQQQQPQQQHQQQQQPANGGYNGYSSFPYNITPFPVFPQVSQSDQPSNFMEAIIRAELRNQSGRLDCMKRLLAMYQSSGNPQASTGQFGDDEADEVRVFRNQNVETVEPEVENLDTTVEEPTSAPNANVYVEAAYAGLRDALMNPIYSHPPVPLNQFLTQAGVDWSGFPFYGNIPGSNDKDAEAQAGEEYDGADGEEYDDGAEDYEDEEEYDENGDDYGAEGEEYEETETGNDSVNATVDAFSALSMTSEEQHNFGTQLDDQFPQLPLPDFQTEEERARFMSLYEQVKKGWKASVELMKYYDSPTPVKTFFGLERLLTASAAVRTNGTKQQHHSVEASEPQGEPEVRVDVESVEVQHDFDTTVLTDPTVQEIESVDVEPSNQEPEPAASVVITNATTAYRDQVQAVIASYIVGLERFKNEHVAL